jgi:hypothetical protein
MWSYTTFIVNEAVVNRKLAVETLMVKTKINKNYDIHKTELLILNNHPYPKHNKKYRWRQNIGTDKTLAGTKYWRYRET